MITTRSLFETHIGVLVCSPLIGLPHTLIMWPLASERTLVCHTTMHRNPINFLYNPGYMTLWCVEVGPVANAREGSTQEHDWARVWFTPPMWRFKTRLAGGYTIRLLNQMLSQFLFLLTTDRQLDYICFTGIPYISNMEIQGYFKGKVLMHQQYIFKGTFGKLL